MARVNTRQESVNSLPFFSTRASAFLVVRARARTSRIGRRLRGSATVKRVLSAAITSSNCLPFKYRRRETDTAILGESARAKSARLEDLSAAGLCEPTTTLEQLLHPLIADCEQVTRAISELRDAESRLGCGYAAFKYHSVFKFSILGLRIDKIFTFLAWTLERKKRSSNQFGRQLLLDRTFAEKNRDLFLPHQRDTKADETWFGEEMARTASTVIDRSYKDNLWLAWAARWKGRTACVCGPNHKATVGFKPRFTSQ